MKTTAKGVRLADLPAGSGVVKGGGIKVPDAPQRVRGGKEPGVLERPLSPCV